MLIAARTIIASYPYKENNVDYECTSRRLERDARTLDLDELAGRGGVCTRRRFESPACACPAFASPSVIEAPAIDNDDDGDDEAMTSLSTY